MNQAIATLLLAGLLIQSSTAADVAYKYLGRINTTGPAFLQVVKWGNQPEFLVTSSFGPLSSGKVNVIPNISQIVNEKLFSSAKTVELSSNFKWPNSVEPVPAEVFGADVHALVVPDGFLVPFKSDGNIYIITTNPSDPTQPTKVSQISTTKSGFFYHYGVWVDVNGDGRLDYVTARGNSKAGQGEMVWLEHPPTGLDQTPWTEHFITKGPDCFFELHTLKGYDGSFIVFAAEFFNKKLTVYQIQKGTGALQNSRVIDGTLGSAYSVKYLDINGDGKFELLVNNHESDNSKAAVFLYEVPADLFAGTFTQTKIASGFKNAFSLLVPNMAPGFPYPLKPHPSLPAHVLIAGDGDQSVHLLSPNSAGAYDRVVIKNLGGTVGSLTFYDFNNDGWLEFLVPNYDGGYIEVFTFLSNQEYLGF